MWKRLLAGVLTSVIIAGNFMNVSASAATKTECFIRTNSYTFKDKAGIKKISVNGQNIRLKKEIKNKKVKFSKQGKYQVNVINQKGIKKIYTIYVDKKKPCIKGVSQNKIYSDEVNITFSDNYALDFIIENGVTKKIKGTAFSKIYKKNGHYDLVVIDKAKNKCKISFDILKQENQSATISPIPITTSTAIPNIHTGAVLTSSVIKTGDKYSTIIELSDDIKYSIDGLYYLKKDDILSQDGTNMIITRNGKEIYRIDIAQISQKVNEISSNVVIPTITPQVTTGPNITTTVATGVSITSGESVLIFDTMTEEDMEEKNFVNGDIIILPIPEREGYSFVGWEKDGQLYSGQYMVSESCTLHAQWKPLMELTNLKNDFIYEIKDNIVYLLDYIGTKTELHIKDCYYENGIKYTTYVMARNAKKVGDSLSGEGCLNCFTEEEKNCSTLRKVSFDENVIIYEKMDDGSIREGVWDYLFYNCPKLWTVTLPKTQCVSMSSMFENCSSFYKQIEIPSTTKNTDYMFAGCTKLVEFPIMSIGNSIASAEGMFKDCENLKGNGCSIYFSGEEDKNLSGCFAGCKNISKGGINIFIRGTYKDVSDIFKNASVYQDITNIKVQPNVLEGWKNILSEYSLSFQRSVDF